MLENDRKNSLKQVCALAILWDEMIITLNTIFEEYCTKIGLETIKKCATEANKVSFTYRLSKFDLYQYSKMVYYKTDQK